MAITETELFLAIYMSDIVRAALQTQVPTTLRRFAISTDPIHQESVFMGPLCDFKALELVATKMRCLKVPGTISLPAVCYIYGLSRVS